MSSKLATLLLKLNSLSDTIEHEEEDDDITLLLKLNSLSDTIDPPLPVDLYSKSVNPGGYLCVQLLKITNTDSGFFVPYAHRSGKRRFARIVDQ